jgi:hypothetical protein
LGWSQLPREADQQAIGSVALKKAHTTEFLPSQVSKYDPNFNIKVPHTCPANMDISRDASIIMKLKTQAIKNTLVSARAVVEKEMLVEFA